MRTSTAAGLLVAGLTGGTIGACNLLIPSYDRYGSTGGSASSTSSSSTGGSGGTGGGTVDAGPTRGIWAVSSAGTSVKSIAVDGSGNVYVTGRADGVVPFGCTPTDGGSGTGYLAELDGSGTCQWIFLFGDSAEGTGVAVDSAGNIGLCATYTGSVTLDPSWGSWPGATSAAQTNSFVALLKEDHTFVWAHAFVDDYSPPQGNHLATSIAFGGGRLAVSVTHTGTARYTTPLGGPAMTINQPADGVDSFAVWFETTTGTFDNYVYARSLGNGSDQTIQSVAIAPGGSVAVTGTTTGSFYFTGPTVSTPASPGSVFVGAADNLAHPLGTVVLGASAVQAGRVAAYDVMSDILVGGTFFGTATPPDAGGLEAKGQSVIVARFDGNAQSFLGGAELGSDDSSANATLGGMVPSGAGGVILAGGFQGTAHLPDGKSITTAAGSTAVYVAKLDLGLDGGVWLEGYGDGQSQQVADAVAVGGTAGDIFIAGHFQGTLNFGCDGGPLDNTSSTDKLFVAKLKP